jgi:hypothetical protein
MDAYNNMRNNTLQNPAKLDMPAKRALISQNMNYSRVGIYKNLMKTPHIKVKYETKNLEKPTNICNVSVVFEHPLDIAQKYSEIGTNNFTKTNNFNPAVLNVIGKDFTGDDFESSDEIRDEYMNIRTTFCTNIIKKNFYPINEKECIYTPYVHVIRQKNVYNLNNLNSVYRVNYISAIPIQQKKSTKFSSTDLINTLAIIENIFQVAMKFNNKVLILSPFGNTILDNNPTEDIIMLYNLCIMKYGHNFNEIVVAIAPYYGKELYNEYEKKIINPNEIVN